MPVPSHPKIYHIVHVDNLSSIIADGFLWSDAVMIDRQGGTRVGMANIKRRRLSLPVHCHSGTHVGEYVPFYFCPRSIMLYVIYRANHPELDYTGGQEPIVHLEADLRNVVQWAETNERRWAFSPSNAGAFYTQFYRDLGQLEEINWNGVFARDFRPQEVKEAKQAEFLFHRSFPVNLIERIGVLSPSVARQVSAAIRESSHRPEVEVLKAWYY